MLGGAVLAAILRIAIFFITGDSERWYDDDPSLMGGKQSDFSRTLALLSTIVAAGAGAVIGLFVWLLASLFKSDSA